MSLIIPSIRGAIFNKLRNYRKADIKQTAKEIQAIIVEYSKQIYGYEHETVEISLKIPILIPPDGKKGDCFSVVSTVRSKFNELGGGSSSKRGYGSWVNKAGIEHSEPHVHICVAIPIISWYTCIPVLRYLIAEEIQPKLMQQEVWLTVDGKNIKGGVNLLEQEIVDSYPTIEQFLGIDQSIANSEGNQDLTSLSNLEIDSIFLPENQLFNDAKSSFLAGDYFSALGKFKQIQNSTNLTLNEYFITKFNTAILEILANNDYDIAEKISEELLLNSSPSAQMYANLIRARIDEVNADKSLQKSLFLATSIGDEYGIFQSLKEKIKIENYSNSVNYAFEILQGLDLINEPYYDLELKLLRAGKFLMMENYEAAINDFEEIIPELRKNKYKGLLSKALHNNALCNRELKRFDQANNMFLKCLELDLKLGLNRSLAITKYNFAVSITDEDRFINYDDGFIGTKSYGERANALLIEALNHIQDSPPSSLHRAIFSKMYSVSVPLESLEYEEIAVRGLIDYYLHLGSKPGILATRYEDLAAIFEEKGDTTSEIAFYKKSINLRRENKLYDSLYWPIKMLAKTYISNGLNPLKDNVFIECMEEMPLEDNQMIVELINKLS